MEERNKSLKMAKGVEQPSFINPNIQAGENQFASELHKAEDYTAAILKADRSMLARAITLTESMHPSHQQISSEIIEACIPYTGNSVRIGISGVPGVGKSTFIEALGSFLLKQDKKIAVLAIDPSSKKTKGSILGDKVRMPLLSTDPRVFVRPSPSAGNPGGVARKTRESIMLCEAAGYDIIFIETVGVGQSETTVHSMVDLFLMLILPGAGDELQGMKRGIMEMSDLIVINKIDDNRKEKVLFARQEYEKALHLMPPHDSGWIVPVNSCSSITVEGIDNVWESVVAYFDLTKANGYFVKRRKDQNMFWFHESIESELMRLFFQNHNIAEATKRLEEDIQSNKISPFHAARQLLDKYLNDDKL